MQRLEGLPYIVGDQPKVLILGTFSGCESLLQKEYYAHGTNKFWEIIFAAFGLNETPRDYELRKKILTDNHIALWDVIESCFRRGAADGNINEAEKNKIEKFLKEHSSIQIIIFNGKNAEKHYNKFFSTSTIKTDRYISTSAATRKIKLETKKEEWRKIKTHLL